MCDDKYCRSSKFDAVVNTAVEMDLPVAWDKNHCGYIFRSVKVGHHAGVVL